MSLVHWCERCECVPSDLKNIVRGRNTSIARRSNINALCADTFVISTATSFQARLDKVALKQTRHGQTWLSTAWHWQWTRRARMKYLSAKHDEKLCLPISKLRSSGTNGSPAWTLAKDVKNCDSQGSSNLPSSTQFALQKMWIFANLTVSRALTQDQIYGFWVQPRSEWNATAALFPQSTPQQRSSWRKFR